MAQAATDHQRIQRQLPVKCAEVNVDIRPHDSGLKKETHSSATGFPGLSETQSNAAGRLGGHVHHFLNRHELGLGKKREPSGDDRQDVADEPLEEKTG